MKLNKLFFRLMIVSFITNYSLAASQDTIDIKILDSPIQISKIDIVTTNCCFYETVFIHNNDSLFTLSYFNIIDSSNVFSQEDIKLIRVNFTGDLGIECLGIDTPVHHDLLIDNTYQFYWNRKYYKVLISKKK